MNNDMIESFSSLTNDFIRYEQMSKSIFDEKKFSDEELQNLNGLMQTSKETLHGLIKETKGLDSPVSDNFISLVAGLTTQSHVIDQINKWPDYSKAVENLSNDLERIRLLFSISTLKKNAIIVGANGSGKSTFVNSLAGSGLTNLTVIPAQKNLFFSKGLDARLRATIDGYRKQYLKSVNLASKENFQTDYEAKVALFNPFSMMISAIVGQFAKLLTDSYPQKDGDVTNAVWLELKVIWGKLIPDITIKTDSDERTIIPLRDGQEYDINQLSDGEKCILFYIGNVLIAAPSGYIVVDEPETFLNPAIYNKLWNLLTDIRKDCQFVFTSHNIEFIQAQQDATIVWCEKWISTSQVVLHPIEDTQGLPRELLSELVGSRKKVLFCEGTRTSYDYQIYSALFLDDYTVFPVDGHDKVIDYTRMFNALPEWIGNSAIGFIDNDGMQDEDVDKYKNKKIYTLPYNEIEMLLLDERVIHSVLDLTLDKSESNTRINTFKEQFFELFKKQKKDILYKLVKGQVDRKLRSSFIDSKREKNLEELDDWVNAIPSSLNVNGVKLQYSDEFDRIVNKDDYYGLLKICPLKRAVLAGLGNAYLAPDYAVTAVRRIRRDKSLNEYLRQTILGK